MRWEQDNDLQVLGPLGLFEEYLSMGQFHVLFDRGRHAINIGRFSVKTADVSMLCGPPNQFVYRGRVIVFFTSAKEVMFSLCLFVC